MTLPGTEQTSADITLGDVRSNQVLRTSVGGHLGAGMNGSERLHTERPTTGRTTEIGVSACLVTLTAEETTDWERRLGTCLRGLVVRDRDGCSAGVSTAI